MLAYIQRFMNQFSVMLDIRELCIITPVWQATEVQASKSFCASYFTKFSVDLDIIQYAVETCWSDEPHAHFIKHGSYKFTYRTEVTFLLGQYSKERALLLFTWYYISHFSNGLFSDVYEPISFKCGMLKDAT